MPFSCQVNQQALDTSCELIEEQSALCWNLHKAWGVTTAALITPVIAVAISDERSQALNCNVSKCYITVISNAVSFSINKQHNSF